MATEFEISVLKGKEIHPYIPELAKLRIHLFRDYPYLYNGSLEYEENYLKTYTNCAESILVAVFADKKIIGASTAIPLKFETKECQAPFIEHDITIDDVFYLGESLLLHKHRGKKIYRHFFEKREEAAKKYGATTATFCAVQRREDDPRRPTNYTSLDQVWQHFGYEKHPELCAYYEWQEIDEPNSSKKPMIYWLKNLC